MSTTSILNVIQYYQRSIEKYQTDETRLLHCVGKLYNLPVKVEHLQETGIGKTVNSLRKYDGEIGSAAKALVAKWKAMVAAEEEPMETNCNQDETNNSNGNGGDTDDEDHYDQNRNTDKIECDELSQHQAKEAAHTEVHNKSKEKGHHKHSTSSSHHKSSSLNTHADFPSSSKHKSKSSHSSSSSSTEKKKSHSDEHHKSRGRVVERKEQKPDKVKEKEVDEEIISSSSGRDKQSSNSHKKEHSNSSEEHHSKKSKSSSDSHKESHSHRHSSYSKGHKDHEKHTSSASKEKERKIQKNAEPTHEKHKSSSKEREHSQDKKKQTSSTKSISSSSTSTHKTKDPASTSTDHTLVSSSSGISAERKRRRHSSEPDSSNESVALKPKAVKRSKAVVAEEHDNEEADFIDSSMGANFADVLGMLNKPSKKSKKLSSALKSPIVSVKASSSTHAKSSSSSSKEIQNKSSGSGSSKINGVRSSTKSSNDASTSRKSDMKPDLLSSSMKLEPLDPSIALELPSISNNYKPMPLNQTVMDCVFASSSSYSNAPKAPVRTLTDAEALHHGISSKTMRTKIYSGIRTGQLMQVPSLFDLCIRVLQKNIDALEYTGGVPFEVLRPVLDRATPQQLLIFEEYNPYLMEDSDTLWQHHVARHYRAQKRKEMESWREMFLRCQDDQERKLNILAESIKQSQKIIAAPVRKTQMAFVDSLVKPPRNVQRKQEQYGTKSKLIATPAARVASLSSVTPNAVKTGDARLRVAATVRDHAQVSNAIRPKKAPLMAKTLQLMRGRGKR